jgi:hypothetical protein
MEANVIKIRKSIYDMVKQGRAASVNMMLFFKEWENRYAKAADRKICNNNYKKKKIYATL